MTDAAKKMANFSSKAAASHAKSALERKALAKSIKDNAKAVNRMLSDNFKAASAAIAMQKVETNKKIAKTNTQIDAHAKQMEKDAKDARAAISALEKTTLGAIAKENKRAAAANKAFGAADAARQKASLKFLRTSLAKAKTASDKKFGKAYQTLANDRRHANTALSGSFKQLNDALAKQAALSDSRFRKTVKDISAARAEAAKAVKQLRSDMATNIQETTAIVRNVEGRLTNQINKVTAEVASAKLMQAGINRKVAAEMKRVEKLSNDRHSADKRARGALRKVMDDNKAAAAEEVAALSKSLKSELNKVNKQAAINKRAMAKDLTDATEKFNDKLMKQIKNQNAAHASLSAATQAATVASSAALGRAQKMFDSKIVQLTNTVAANAAKVERGIAHLTGVVNDISKANAADRALIRKQTKAMERDLNTAVTRAISIGEAKARAVEQRVAAHLKKTKSYLQTELIEQSEKAADNVFAILNGKRQHIADNYLSLKAYAVSAKDKIEDYKGAGKGLALSSIGDLLGSVGALSAIKAKPAQGVSMGGDSIPALFSGGNFKSAGSVKAINGLVNEFTQQCNQVRNRWPMGLGKYLLDKLEQSMTGKGVLQVDKVDGHHGNYVYVNGRSVGLSNKLSDFSTLATKMVDYEAVLAKLTAKIQPSPPHGAGVKRVSAGPPQWQGD